MRARWLGEEWGKHGVMLVMNRTGPALGEASSSSSSRVFDGTGVAFPKETRPLSWSSGCV